MDDSILKGKTILVVDDEIDLREIIASELDFMGAHIKQAGNIMAASAILREAKVDLVISDIRMPGGTGIELLEEIKSKNTMKPPVILITGFADVGPEDAYAKGSEGLLNKPFQLDELIKASTKLIGPFENRFHADAVSVKNVLKINSELPLSQSPNIKIGRGGFLTSVKSDVRYELNEVIGFEFNFQDLKSEGKCIVRWMKLNDDGSLVNLGLEFCSFVESNASILPMLKKSSEIAYIPKSY